MRIAQSVYTSSSSHGGSIMREDANSITERYQVFRAETDHTKSLARVTD